LRLIGLPIRRILLQLFIEGVLIAVVGSMFGLALSLLSEGIINRFFQWRYDTALVFVRITPQVAAICVAIAIPLGVSATVVASWALLRGNGLRLDMLLLSQGLVISMRGLLERTGFDLRVTATDALPGQGPLIPNAVDRAQAISRLPSVRSAIALRFADAVVLAGGPRGLSTTFQGVAGTAPVYPWTILRGRDITPGLPEIVINE